MHPDAQAIPASPPGQSSHPDVAPSEWLAAVMSTAMLVACAALITAPAAMARATSTAIMRANRRIFVAYTASLGAVHDGVSQSTLFTDVVT